MNNNDSLRKKILDFVNWQAILARRKMCQSFPAFRKFYFPHYHKTSDAEFHGEFASLLGEMTKKRGVKYAIAAPRGSAKSTIVSLEYVIYSICYKTEPFIVIVSSTSNQAVGHLTDIKKELETNPLLIRDFPDICEIGKKPGPPRWTREEIITRNGIRVTAMGTGQQIRGKRNQQFRPSLIILDDIETDETSQNPENYNKLHDWVTKSVLKAGSNSTNVVFIGTIHHYNSLLAQFTGSNNNPGWQKRIYRSVVSWSEHPELWENWVRIFNNKDEYASGTGVDAARAFYEANKEAMLQGTKVLWPASKSYYDLMVMREEEGYYSFDSEMQNEPVDPRNCHFNTEENHFWDDKFKTEEELIATVNTCGVFYGACDPSMGKQNRHGDFSAIVTILLDLASGKMYVVDADIAIRKPDKTIADILAYQTRRKYRAFGFETNQFQEYMADELRKKSEEQGCYLPLEKISHASDKKGRIESIQSLVKNGTILFSRKHYMLLEQMKFFPKGSHDDGLDALEMVISLCMKRASGGGEFLVLDYDPIQNGYRDEQYCQQPIYKIVLPELNKHRPAFG